MSKTIALSIVLLIYLAALSVARYQQFYGSWSEFYYKTLYYSMTGIFILYFTVDEIRGYRVEANRSLSILCKLTLMVNFTLFALGRLQLPGSRFDIFIVDAVIFFLLAEICLRYSLFKRNKA